MTLDVYWVVGLGALRNDISTAIKGPRGAHWSFLISQRIVKTWPSRKQGHPRATDLGLHNIQICKKQSSVAHMASVIDTQPSKVLPHIPVLHNGSPGRQVDRRRGMISSNNKNYVLSDFNPQGKKLHQLHLHQRRDWFQVSCVVIFKHANLTRKTKTSGAPDTWEMENISFISKGRCGDMNEMSP